MTRRPATGRPSPNAPAAPPRSTAPRDEGSRPGDHAARPLGRRPRPVGCGVRRRPGPALRLAAQRPDRESERGRRRMATPEGPLDGPELLTAVSDALAALHERHY